MSDTPPLRLHWPDDLDETRFLDRHWQREPCLLRRALPDFRTPLPPDELAGLALEPDTAPRLIRRDATGRYALEHGPFDADVFGTLGPSDWSLLVTDVDKHLPELARWLAPFRVAPDWRLDDLMVSYAPDGASVGAHVDEYDVFLLQASGTRRWSIERFAGERAGDTVARRLVADGDLRLLADFAPTDTWDLVPGDVLYLPPGVPHHGVAVGDDCTTWSIGFRAPSTADVLLHFAELLAERLPSARLRDAGNGRGLPGQIDEATIDAVGSLWRSATTLDRDTLTELAGRLLTRPDAAGLDLHGGNLHGGRAEDDDAGYASPAPVIVPAPFARLGWSGDGERVRLFADGECFDCSRRLAVALCAEGAASDAVEAADRALLGTLLERGVLVGDDIAGR